jgi:hypothetical protein
MQKYIISKNISKLVVFIVAEGIVGIISQLLRIKNTNAIIIAKKRLIFVTLYLKTSNPLISLFIKKLYQKSYIRRKMWPFYVI